MLCVFFFRLKHLETGKGSYGFDCLYAIYTSKKDVHTIANGE